MVYDYLSSEELLALARPDAELIYVGKIAGNHAMKQGDINKLLIAKAKEGKVVARLKGGDPYSSDAAAKRPRNSWTRAFPLRKFPAFPVPLPVRPTRAFRSRTEPGRPPSPSSPVTKIPPSPAPCTTGRLSPAAPSTLVFLMA